MSVIWSGVTEEGAVVPVQVTSEGKVVAVGDGPEGEYLKLTGGNLTGDLTLGVDRITLNADGSATFAKRVETNEYFYANGPGSYLVVKRTGAIDNRTVAEFGGDTVTARIAADGSAEFAGNVQAEGSATFSGVTVNPPSGTPKLILDADASDSDTISLCGQIPGVSNAGFTIRNETDSRNDMYIDGNGRATFAGDVVIGSRGEQWLIRESNGVAMLVQQTLLKQPRGIEKLRDLPNELDLIEAALNEVMDKLRMTPPAGWPVWNGSDNA